MHITEVAMTASKLPDGFALGFKISQDSKAAPLPRGVHDGSKDFWVWIALDPKSPAAAEWLHSQAAVDPQVANACLEFNTRPVVAAAQVSGAALKTLIPHKPEAAARRGGGR
jgi:hypothetical protein